MARLAGLPELVLARAKAILSSLEAGAPLPSGKHASVRGRSQTGSPQLDLFGQVSSPPALPSPSLELLKAVDVDRLTPLDALTLVAKMKALLDRE